jgi:hypothetical protein
MRLASIVRDEQTYLTQELQSGLLAYGEQMPHRWQVPRDRFWQEHIALQKRYVWQAAQTLSQTPQDVTYERIMAVVTMAREKRAGSRIEIPGGLAASLNQIHFVIEQVVK